MSRSEVIGVGRSTNEFPDPSHSPVSVVVVPGGAKTSETGPTVTVNVP